MVKESLSNETKNNFFIRLIFNTNDGYYYAGIYKAYLDFCRTLKINDEINNHEISKKNMEKFLYDKLILMLEKNFKDQEEFDVWHKELCYELIVQWNILTYGQVQKWINMTLKYWLLLGEERIKNIYENAVFFHIPIDSYVQKGMFKQSNPKPWSRISDYEAYLWYQIEYRNNNKSEGKIPIIAEFEFFNNFKP